MKIKAAVARTHDSPLQLESVDLAEPRENEILVRLVASGVSAADLDAIAGRLPIALPFVPGAEGAGIVERIGAEVTGLAPGDCVIVSYDYCGHCARCAAGLTWSCIHLASLNASGKRHDGSAAFEDASLGGSFFGQSSFGTHLVCRGSRAIRVPADAPLELLACLGGEVLLGAGTVLHGFRVKPGDTLVISGANAVGLAACGAARARAAKMIVVVETDERRRSLASDAGADVVVDEIDGLNDLVRSLAADGVDFAFEATGDAAARAACYATLAQNGTASTIRLPGEEASAASGEASPRTLLVDAHAPLQMLIPELVALNATGDLPLGKLIDFFPFEHVNDALDALRQGHAVKPVLRFSLGGFGDLDRALVQTAAEDVEEPETSPVEAETATVLS